MKTYSDDDYVFVDENGNEYISTPSCEFPIIETMMGVMLFVVVLGWLYT